MELFLVCRFTIKLSIIRICLYFLPHMTLFFVNGLMLCGKVVTSSNSLVHKLFVSDIYFQSLFV